MVLLKLRLSLAFLLVSIAAVAVEGTGIGGVGPECAACGLAINELEGFLIEPRNEGEIETFLTDKVCPKLSSKMQAVCSLLASNIPAILKYVDDGFQVGNVCMDLKLCPVDLNAGPDMQPIPTYTIDLDVAPNQRWLSLCARQDVSQHLSGLIGILQEILPEDVFKAAGDAGRGALFLMPSEYAGEIVGCAQAAEVDTGMLALLNMAYELTDACTSIVAMSPTGQIFHARNLDFGAGGFLTSTMRNISAIINFQSNGQTVFREAGFVGFVGFLSGQKPGQFTVTVNTRFYQGGAKKSILSFFDEFVFALKNYPNAHLAAFLVRDAVVKAANFAEAVEIVSNTELIADIYFTLSGINAGEGVVVSRNRTGPSDVWYLKSSSSGVGSWFVLQTNYDHWEPVPWFDNRRDPGIADMEAMGQNNITLAGLLNVLSIKPTLNLLSSYSMLAINNNSTFQVWNRRCPYPCAL